MTTATRAPHVESIDPSSNRLLASYAVHGPDEIDGALAAVAAAQREWEDLTTAQRADALRFVAGELLRRREECAALITAEMGKTLGEARAEIDKCRSVCEYYAEWGAGYRGECA